MSSRKYVASFVVSPSGEFVPTEISTRILESNKVIMVIDEFSKKIYLWLGKESSLNNKMGAKRTVKSIPTFGLRAKGVGFPIGRDCKIIEVDESIAESDNSVRSHLAELAALLKKPHAKQADGIWYAKETSFPEKGETVKPEAKILEKRILYEMSHLEKETTEKSKKGKFEENKK